jgi:hypothetical protein
MVQYIVGSAWRITKILSIKNESCMTMSRKVLINGKWLLLFFKLNLELRDITRHTEQSSRTNNKKKYTSGSHWRRTARNFAIP